jgi:hypothetical protein
MTIYATTTDLANALGRDVAVDDPAAIAALELASAMVEQFIGRDVAQVEDDVEVIDGTGTSHIQLRHWPVSAVSTVVEEDEELVANDDYEWSADGYVRRISNNCVSVPSGWTCDNQHRWTRKLRAIEVTYTHGYATIPDVIRLVTAQAAARILDTPSTIKQESIGGYSVTYTAGAPLQATELQMLERFRDR